MPGTLHQRIYRQGDRILIGVCWGLFVLALALASWHDTWVSALLVGLPTALITHGIAHSFPASRLTRVVVATATMVFSALIIHQSHGMIEMHFSVFCLLAFLLFYRDWLPIVVAATVIALHHLTFNYLQQADVGVYVFDHGTGLGIVMTHAVFVVVESVVLVYMAVLGQRDLSENQELHSAVQRLMQDDGSIDLTWRPQAATTPLLQGFERYMQAIHHVMKAVVQASSDLSATSDRLDTLTKKTHVALKKQQQESEHVTTAVTEMSSSVKEVAQSVSTAAELASSANEGANNSQQVVNKSISLIVNLAQEVNKATGVIKKLADDSNNISLIVDVIRGIAEQTNLLALNAAIEAARAGEQGRGFAVVADEVRTLASRTQESTREIQSMIERLQQNSEQAVKVMSQGSQLAQDGAKESESVGMSLRGIIEAVGHINDMTNQIAAATEEQSMVMEEVNRSIVAIRDAGTGTFEMGKHSQETSQTLSKMAKDLSATIQRFRV